MVSQGSATTSVRYGGICNVNFEANSVLDLAVKYFENRLIFHHIRSFTITYYRLGNLQHKLW